MFPSLVIISLLAFPPLDTQFRLQQFSLFLFCISIHYRIAHWNLVIHKFPQNWYVSMTIHIFTDLVKALLKSTPWDIVQNLQTIAWNLHYLTIGFKSQLWICNWIELSSFFDSTSILVESLCNQHSKPLQTWSVLTLKSLKPILDRLCGGEDLTLLGGDDGVAWDKLSEDTTCRSSVSMARSTHTHCHLPVVSILRVSRHTLRIMRSWQANSINAYQSA